MAEERHLLAAVLAAPDDDLPRLVYADFLRESGQTERADFIEVQLELAKVPAEPEMTCSAMFFNSSRQAREHSASCGWCRWVGEHRDPSEPLRKRERDLLEHHELTLLAGAPLLSVGWQANSTWVPEAEWEFRRGFVDRVEMPLRWWCGGDCPACQGTGAYVDPRNFDDTGRWLGGYETTDCDHCSGTGKIAAVGPAVVSRHPVAVCRISDSEADPIGDEFCWVRRRDGLIDTGACLPSDVFDLLRDGRYESAGDAWPERYGVEDDWVIYATRELANTALSTAALAWAKAQPAG